MNFPLSAYARLSVHLPARFSSAVWREWGLLFRNTFNPGCFDANHAVFLDLSRDLSGALDEIEGHFSRRHIRPRVHSGFVPGEGEILLPLLQSRGYVVQRSAAKLLLQTGPCPPPGGFSFEQPRELTVELASLLLESGGEWLPGRMEYLLAHPECAAFAARGADGTLAAFLCILRGYGCAAVQDVFTLPNYRRQGLCFGLLSAALAAFRADWPALPLFLEAEGEAAIRLYTRAGFSEIDAPGRWAAFLP